VTKPEKAVALSTTAGALGAIAALTFGAPAAQAEPDVPPPPVPGQQSISTQAAGDSGAPSEQTPPTPTEVPHLSSLQNLPPGTTTDVPPDQAQGRGISYLRDLWHAVQTQDISGKDALLLLTQRPLDPNAMPTNGLPPGPQARPDAAPPPGGPPPDGPPPDAAPPGPVLPWLAPPGPPTP
jgi:hypothetical protein